MTFQHLMVPMAPGLNWSLCLVDLDSVIMLGQSFLEHLEKQQMVPVCLREVELKLKPSKCSLDLYQFPEVQFLGHLVSREGVQVDPANMERVATWPTPTTRGVGQARFNSYLALSVTAVVSSKSFTDKAKLVKEPRKEPL